MKGKFQGIFIASDFDGTMTADGSVIPKKNIEAVDYFIKNGGIFSLSTGRSLHSISRRKSEFPSNGPVICCNGALIYDAEKQKILRSWGMDKNILKIASEVMNDFPDIGIEGMYDFEMFLIKKDKINANHIEYEEIPNEEVSVDKITAPLQKLLFTGPAERIALLDPYLRAKEGFDYTILYSSPRFLEVMPVGINKGTGLLNAAEILKINHENTYAIGDYLNDYHAIKMAGTGVVPENAASEIKEIADVIVCDHNEGAVADLIEYIDGKLTAAFDNDMITL
ncbi:MAG: Cof-type HAD-IIB family hydrolase [Bacillota bacterium]|nr:Cof-type HAD-IIB family hydrolase [Bacillota bacterium]